MFRRAIDRGLRGRSGRRETTDRAGRPSPAALGVLAAVGEEVGPGRRLECGRLEGPPAEAPRVHAASSADGPARHEAGHVLPVREHHLALAGELVSKVGPEDERVLVRRVEGHGATPAAPSGEQVCKRWRVVELVSQDREQGPPIGFGLLQGALIAGLVAPSTPWHTARRTRSSCGSWPRHRPADAPRRACDASRTAASPCGRLCRARAIERVAGRRQIGCDRAEEPRPEVRRLARRRRPDSR